MKKPARIDDNGTVYNLYAYDNASSVRLILQISMYNRSMYIDMVFHLEKIKVRLRSVARLAPNFCFLGVNKEQINKGLFFTADINAVVQNIT